MNDMTVAAPLGHNNPPVTTADDLGTRYHEDVTRAKELLDAAKTAPDKIENDDDSTKVADLIKSMRDVEKRLEGSERAEKTPYKNKIDQIGNFFKILLEPLETTRKKLNARNTDYLEAKKRIEQERLRKEEEAKREAARIAAQKAEELAQANSAASFALNELQRLAAEAKASRDAASSEQELAAALVAEAKADLALVKSDVATKNAEFKKRIAEGQEVPKEELDAARDDAERRIAECRKKLTDAEGELATARQKAIAAREEAKRRQDEEAKQAREVREKEAQQKAATQEAERTTRQADKIAAKADGPGADLSRTRSLHGATASLSRRWVATVVDIDQLDKAALWSFIHPDAISSALHKWMMNQPVDQRRMAGAHMEEISEAVTR